MHVIIPMSGISKRFTEYGYTIPKFLIEIEKKPMIEHVINLFPNETKFTFICNNKHLYETNIRNILEQLKPNCNINMSFTAFEYSAKHIDTKHNPY